MLVFQVEDGVGCVEYADHIVSKLKGRLLISTMYYVHYVVCVLCSVCTRLCLAVCDISHSGSASFFKDSVVNVHKICVPVCKHE